MGAPATLDARFVVVPFLPARQPALGVSSLLAVLRARGLAGDVCYLNLGYGERVGWDLYQYVADGLPTPFLLGEVLFSEALWGAQAPPFELYEERVMRWFDLAAGPCGDAKGWRSEWVRRRDRLAEARQETPRIVAEWADAVLDGAPRVLGFTSTFQQSVPALALAREVRRRFPRERVALLFGGANCEDDMGRALAESFPFLDAVVSGEAETTVCETIEPFLRPLDPETNGRPTRFVQGSMVHDMDALPVPDFDDYFRAVEATSLGGRVWLAAESSRGCWWGMKSHCTFCGLNGGTMGFRSKSPRRFAAELDELASRYGTRSFALTDNILDMGYLKTLLPDLVAEGRSYDLFYETKSNLRKDQLELLAAAGVSSLQPGIESFSTPILKLMRKGTTRLQNVQVLKWCAELGISVVWNFLYGFPGEEPAEYAEMAELLPALVHLPPPTGASSVRLDRFGPYWRDPAAHGLRKVRRYWSYDFAFPGVPESDRERLAYFFEYEHPDGRIPLDYAHDALVVVAAWRSTPQSEVRLELQRDGGEARVLDTRPHAPRKVVPLDPLQLAVLRVLDGLRGRARVPEALRELGVDASAADCDRVLDDLVERRFVLEERECCLSLVIDPEERERVADRRAALRARHYGFTWPEDFSEPRQRELVKAALLAAGAGAPGG